ncbi:MAG: IS5 family transposase [Candidatus Omnitrophica bacterium]|nr:IS5 family transposase [Candidatus Omnitrophota bacterium]
MYTRESNEHQYSFTHDWFVVPDLDENHELIKIAKAIDWTSLSDKLAQFYCPGNGRPTKPARAKVGLLILKHLYHFPDADLVDMLKRDIYAQYLCDISLKEAKDFINPSTLSKFRKQIGLEGVKLIEQEVLRSLERVKLLKGRKLICDTTVIPSNIAYPTDISLLEKIRQRTVRYLDEARQFGGRHFRTYKRIAKKAYIQYQKIRHHTIQSRRRTQKKLLQFSRRNVSQLKEVVKEISQAAGTFLENSKEKFLKETKAFLDTVSSIITQQEDIYKGLEVKERIVSIHKPHIRPMVRGKYPVEVEFGPKVLLSQKNGFLFLDDLQFNNISDVYLLDTALQRYAERFGNLPTQLTADRGFWSSENYTLAQEYGVSKIAIENKGKSSYLKGKPFARRLRRLRCQIEASISLAKRKFGLDRIRYSIEQGEEIWVRLSLIAMNLKTATGYG